MLKLFLDGDLASLTHLQTLRLHSTQVSDLSPLASLPHIAWLNLERSYVSDLTPLSKRTTLRDLSLRGTNTTPAQAKALQAALPQCRVHF